MPTSAGTEAHRERILEVALALLNEHGRDAVTTRSVAEAANVQPPVLYRLFTDKTGLLHAVAGYGFAAYLARKAPTSPSGDPVEALRSGWDLHISFGLAHPALYRLMYTEALPGEESPAAQHAAAMLRQHMEHVAAAGRLRVSVPRACALFHAAAVGVVLALLSTPPEQRDLSLSAIARDHALDGITVDAPATPDSTLSALANQLRARLEKDSQELLSTAEHALLSEWLQRIADARIR